MNASRRTIRNVATVLTIPLVLCCLGGAAKHITTASEARAEWAESLNSEDDAIRYYAAGNMNEVFSIATGEVNSQSECDEIIDKIEVSRDSTAKLRNRGFDSIACGVATKPIVVPPEIKRPACCDGDIDARAPMFSTES